jgi:hypothetical protein
MFQLDEVEESLLRSQPVTANLNPKRRFSPIVFERLDTIEDDLSPKLPDNRKKIGLK